MRSRRLIVGLLLAVFSFAMPLVLNGCGDSGTNPCCRVCSTTISSKPCGDLCIFTSVTCNEPPGCACAGGPGQ
jgi:hypothetical protein